MGVNNRITEASNYNKWLLRSLRVKAAQSISFYSARLERTAKRESHKKKEKIRKTASLRPFLIPSPPFRSIPSVVVARSQT